MKKIEMHERIRTRAYFLALEHGYVGSPETYWLTAEAIEQSIATALRAKRSAAATKAAATRRSKTMAPAEMLVAGQRRPVIRLTAH